MNRLFKFLMTAILFASCSPKVLTSINKTYEPSLSSAEDVIVMENVKQLPVQAERLGEVRVGDTGFTATSNGTFDKVVGLAKIEAWRAGGNLLIINQHAYPSLMSTVHNINADIFRTDTASYRKLVSMETGVIIQPSETQYTMRQGVMVVGQKPGFSVRAFAGYGRRINKLDPSLSGFEKEHMRRSLSGFIMGADATYFWQSGYGLGFRVKNFHSSSSDYATIIYDDNSTESGTLTDKFNITFIGPLLAGRSVSADGKHLFFSNFGFGALLYSNPETFNKISAKSKGSTFGMDVNLAYSYMINDNLSVGADLSCMMGVLTSLEVSSGSYSQTFTLDDNNKIGLATLGLSVGLRYSF